MNYFPRCIVFTSSDLFTLSPAGEVKSEQPEPVSAPGAPKGADAGSAPDNIEQVSPLLPSQCADEADREAVEMHTQILL